MKYNYFLGVGIGGKQANILRSHYSMSDFRNNPDLIKEDNFETIYPYDGGGQGLMYLLNEVQEEFKLDPVNDYMDISTVEFPYTVYGGKYGAKKKMFAINKIAKMNKVKG